jgi:hypothetical protein
VNLVFDIDGTLTEPRQPLAWDIRPLSLIHNVYLCTGASYAQVVRQIPQADGMMVFTCMGNEYLENGIVRQCQHHRFTTSLLSALWHVSELIEYRPSMLNVRVGPDLERRRALCNEINARFKEYECMIGGSRSVDVVPRGRGKEQIAAEIGSFVYFGDRIFPGGNDWALAKRASAYHNVSGPQETRDILAREYACPI